MEVSGRSEDRNKLKTSFIRENNINELLKVKKNSWPVTNFHYLGHGLSHSFKRFLI